MSNKARRRVKKHAQPGEPYSRVRERQAKEKAEMSKRRRSEIETRITEHAKTAAGLTASAEFEAAKGDYGAAGHALREASNYYHLAKAEKRKLPNEVQ